MTKIHTVTGGHKFWCPACVCTHVIGWDSRETFNSRSYSPTFAGRLRFGECEMYMTAGRVEYTDGPFKGYRFDMDDCPKNEEERVLLELKYRHHRYRRVHVLGGLSLRALPAHHWSPQCSTGTSAPSSR